jgi:putative endonuclease
MPGSENSTAIMFYYVYVLESLKTSDLYIGFTADLRKRLNEHNRGLNFSTRPYIPWQLVHYEAYRNEKDAKRREKYLKTSQGSRLLKRMLKEYFYSKKIINNKN